MYCLYIKSTLIVVALYISLKVTTFTSSHFFKLLNNSTRHTESLPLTSCEFLI